MRRRDGCLPRTLAVSLAPLHFVSASPRRETIACCQNKSLFAEIDCCLLPLPVIYCLPTLLSPLLPPSAPWPLQTSQVPLSTRQIQSAETETIESGVDVFCVILFYNLVFNFFIILFCILFFNFQAKFIVKFLVVCCFFRMQINRL